MPHNNIKLGTNYSKLINKNISAMKSKKSTIEKAKPPIKLLKVKDHQKKYL